MRFPFLILRPNKTSSGKYWKISNTISVGRQKLKPKNPFNLDLIIPMIFGFLKRLLPVFEVPVWLLGGSSISVNAPSPRITFFKTMMNMHVISAEEYQTGLC